MVHEAAMTPLQTCRRLACVVAALAAGALTVTVPQARAAGAGNDAQATADRCAAIPPGFGHPPVNLTPVTLQVLQRSIEPVPATDGLIHLVYAAQATNTQAQAADITSVVPVDPLAGFSPTGRNLITDAQGRDVAGKVRLFSVSPDALPHEDPEPAEPALPFSARVPAGNAGLMFFDVTYTDPAQIPRLLAHAITLASPSSSPPGLTNPVPVGCRPLAILHPPLVGHGWTAFSGCCTYAAYHRDSIPPVNGALEAGQQFAIDYEQLGPNGTCCNGPVQALTSWWGYDTPVLAAAPGVVAEVVDGLPDEQPVGTVSPDLPIANFPGNSVVEDIGGGRYVTYAHLQPGSIPAAVRKGARLGAGDPVGRVGNSGNSDAPHLHFQLQDSPAPLDAAGLPFVFDTQLFEGSVVPAGDFVSGLSIDRTGAGVRDGLMPARNGVFGYNLSQ
jgi:peptidase M23-like protein